MLGPDSFPLIVYQKAWNFMKIETMAVAHDLQDMSFVSWMINTTFLTLIPKVECPMQISEYCPASLLQGVYNILDKTLATRFLYQGAAVRGMNIFEEILIANELRDSN